MRHEHITHSLTCCLFPTIWFSGLRPLTKSRRWNEMGRYCAEMTASILFCAAYLSPAKALNLCNKTLNLHNVQPKISKLVVKVRWGCSYDPKGKTEVLKREAISPLRDTVTQGTSWVQTATVPTPGPCSKYLTLLLKLLYCYFATWDIIFSGQLRYLTNFFHLWNKPDVIFSWILKGV